MSDDMALIENHELAEDFWANLGLDVREGLIFLVQGFMTTQKSLSPLYVKQKQKDLPLFKSFPNS